MFSSVNFNIKVHSAEEKLGFRARLLTFRPFLLFPPLKRVHLKCGKTGLVRLEVSLIADS